MVTGIKEMNAVTLSVLITLISTTLVTAQIPVVVSTARCNLIGAADCFDEMQSFTQPHQITGDPLTEIYTPCQKQMQQIGTLRSCLEETLTECPVIMKDAEMMISQAEYFCKQVTTNCTDFSAKYRTSLTCITQMFTAITKPVAGNNATKNCGDFADCLVTQIAQCHSLSMFLDVQWKMFEPTCAIATVQTPPELQTTQPSTTPTLACPTLQEVAMAINTCHETFLKTVESTSPVNSLNVTEYCNAVMVFSQCCNNSVSSCPDTSAYHDILLNSITYYHNALSPVCGTQPDGAVCSMGEMKTCFETVSASLWKVENVLVENILGAGQLNLTKFLSDAKQLTTINRDIESMCQSLNQTLQQTESCIANEINGCSSAVKSAYTMNTGYLENLCQGFETCGNLSTVAGNLAVCGDTALSALRGLLLSPNINNITAMKPNFCNIFNELMTCMQGHMTSCHTSNENIMAIYQLLVDDLDSVCDDFSFSVIQRQTFSEDLTKFISCSNMPLLSYELGQCTNKYLYTMAHTPTNFTAICSELDEWEECTKEVAEDCEVLYNEIFAMTDKARQLLAASCPRPTTTEQPPPTVVSSSSPSIVTDDDGNVLNDTMTTEAPSTGVQVYTSFVTMVMMSAVAYLFLDLTVM